MKEHIYSTDEYEVKIGDPVVDAEVKASSTSVAIPCEAIADGEYLVSLEVNGTVAAHRELLAFASGSCTVGDYPLAYSSYAVTVSTTSNNDVVRLKVEPVDVYVTDAMKAAVAKVAPATPDELPAVGADDKGKFLHANESTGALEWAEGGSGGGVLVVNGTWGDDGCTLDKTWQEIHDGGFGVVAIADGPTINYCPIIVVAGGLGPIGYQVRVIYEGDTLELMTFTAPSASDYPTYTE